MSRRSHRKATLNMSPIDYIGAALHIVNTYLRAESMARGLGLTLDEWKQAVESTSVLIQCGYTPDEIEAAAMMHARGESSTVARFGTAETKRENDL